MSEERKTRIRVPEAYVPLLEDLRLLQADGANPNRMTARQQEMVWRSLQKYGWTYPIIANRDGVFADGEQRAQVCLRHGEFYAPVLRLPVSDVDRRLLRQILNKLRGRHSRELDLAEYARIIEQGERGHLEALLASVGEKLPEELTAKTEFSAVTVPATFEVVIECKDEAEQRRVYDWLRREGYKCRVLTL